MFDRDCTVWLRFPRVTGPWYRGIVNYRVCALHVSVTVLDEIPGLGMRVHVSCSEYEMYYRDPLMDAKDKPEA
jgi:hypothetical protein